MTETTSQIGSYTPDIWECFQDSSYYDMWCVRRIVDRKFGHAFHLINGGEAQALCRILNKCVIDERLLQND